MNRRIAALFAIVSMFAFSLVAYVADADPIQVWNGDLDGSTNATKIVTGAKGKPLPTSGSGTLTWDGGAWFFGPSIAPALAGQALFTDDAGTSTTWAYPHGDVDASATDPGALTVNAIQGFGVSNAVPSSTNVLAYSSGLWRPTALTTANITPGAAGTFLVTNGPPATAWSTLDTFDTTHGRITAGGGGTDLKVVCGPLAGAETSWGACAFLPTATAPNTTNYAFLGNGTDTYMNAPSGAAFTSIGGSSAFEVTSTGLYLLTPSLLQTGPTVTGLTVGTNKAGASLTLQADASKTFASFSGTNPATTGEIRAPNNTTIIAARNAANSADLALVALNASNNATFGDCTSVGACLTVNASGSTSLSAVGGWVLTWSSGGSLSSTAGNMSIGTTAGTSSYHTKIVAGNGQTVIDTTAGTAATTGTTTIAGSLALTTRTVTASFTVDTTTTDEIIFVDCTTSSVTVTLPAPTAGRVLTVIDQKNNCNASSGKEITLARHASESIDGSAANVTIATSGSRTNVWSDGTNWFTQMGTKAN